METGNKNKDRKKIEMRQIANKQLTNLLSASVDVEHATIIFKRLKNNEFTTGTTKQDNWLREILLTFIIIKSYTLFDSHNRALSLGKFLESNACHITDCKNIENINDRFKKIKNDNYLLIKQIINNRHENGHIPHKPELGVTKEVADKIKEFGKMIGNEKYKNQKSVANEYMRFSVGNFPTEEVSKMTKELSKLIMGIQYPKTLE